MLLDSVGRSVPPPSVGHSHSFPALPITNPQAWYKRQAAKGSGFSLLGCRRNAANGGQVLPQVEALQAPTPQHVCRRALTVAVGLQFALAPMGYEMVSTGGSKALPGRARSACRERASMSVLCR